MAVARDVLTQNVGGATSFTHTPVGTPRGVTVLIVSTSATDTVTGVTYGGTAMNEATGSPVVSTSGEGGVCYAYTLGASVPTGAQTVEITGTGTLRVIVQSATAGGDCEFVVGTFDAAGVNGDQTVTLATGGRESAVTLVAWSGAGTTGGVNPLTAWTAAAGGEADEGSETDYRYSFDTVGTADVSAGATMTAAEHLTFIAVAIVEAAGGATYTLTADAGSYALTGTAASLEFGREVAAAAGSYALTGTAANLNKGRTVVADAGSYTLTGTAAALEFNREIIAGAGSYLISGSDVTLTYAALSTDAPPLTYGAGRLSPARVRAKYEEIEAIERRIQAKEEVEREKVRKQEEAKRQLAELEEKKRQTKTIAERRRKLEARIEAYQSEITDLRDTMIALMDEIERARVEVELQQTIADRRRRMLLLIAAAS